jgi:hypothetical protein
LQLDELLLDWRCQPSGRRNDEADAGRPRPCDKRDPPALAMALQPNWTDSGLSLESRDCGESIIGEILKGCALPVTA